MRRPDDEISRQAWERYADNLRRDFPKELLARRCWLRWYRLPNHDRPEKPKKVPVPPYNDTYHYQVFDNASPFNGGVFAGLGVGCVEQDFTILDVDNNTDVASLPDWARECRYWEKSPSEKGLRGFFLGRLPEGGSGVRIVDGVEVYRDKWATVTGNVIKSDGALSSLPAALIESWKASTPVFRASSEPNNNNDGGWWTREALLDLLTAWKDCLPDFDFRPTGRRDGFQLTCPGNPPSAWPDSNQHSTQGAALSDDTIVWVENGWATFNCLHAHCLEKTWPSLCAFYDPEKIFFDVDEWLEAALQGGAR